jgi:hypothetical protein
MTKKWGADLRRESWQEDRFSVSKLLTRKRDANFLNSSPSMK